VYGPAALGPVQRQRLPVGAVAQRRRGDGEGAEEEEEEAVLEVVCEEIKRPGRRVPTFLKIHSGKCAGKCAAARIGIRAGGEFGGAARALCLVLHGVVSHGTWFACNLAHKSHAGPRFRGRAPSGVGPQPRGPNEAGLAISLADPFARVRIPTCAFGAARFGPGSRGCPTNASQTCPCLGRLRAPSALASRNATRAVGGDRGRRTNAAKGKHEEKPSSPLPAKPAQIRALRWNADADVGRDSCEAPKCRP